MDTNTATGKEARMAAEAASASGKKTTKKTTLGWVGERAGSLTAARVVELLHSLDKDYRDDGWGYIADKDEVAELLTAWLLLRAARRALAGSQQAVDDMRQALGMNLSVALHMQNDKDDEVRRG